MATTYAVRPVGPTYAISVGSTQTQPLLIASPVGDVGAFAEFTNSGTSAVCVTLSPAPTGNNAATTAALVFPSAGAPTAPNSFILPGSMQMPRAVPVPYPGFVVGAIGAVAGPVTVFVTPVSPV